MRRSDYKSRRNILFIMTHQGILSAEEFEFELSRLTDVYIDLFIYEEE